MSEPFVIKMKAGKFLVPVQFTPDGDKFIVRFKYNKLLLAEIKSMEGARWHPEQKYWTIKASERNVFNLQYMLGKNVFERYDRPLVPFEPTRPLYAHQCGMAQFGLSRRQCILAGEMGTGKTLAAVEIMERSGVTDWWWIGPKAALKAVEYEFRKWQSRIMPLLITYDMLKKVLARWEDGKPAPGGLILDECSRVKTPTAQRSVACATLAAEMRKDHEDPYVILMSGSPAPKSPDDWWNLTEIACPGFLKEGSRAKLKQRLAVIKQSESLAGGVFPELVAWHDGSDTCAECGKPKDDPEHTDILGLTHAFVPVQNEVGKLYNRMKGLVLVTFKKDCLDLPDKVYREIQLDIADSTYRAANIIASKARRVVEAMTMLRELSDGFQYENIIKDGREERLTHYLPTPKEAALTEIMEEHEDIGRIVIYAGFTGSIDRVCEVVKKLGWDFIKVDGRGWFSTIPSVNKDYLGIFQDKIKEHPRVAFIAQPGAGGMGLTLTASPTIVYWSNDFNAESRIQSEDRIHRIGMDKNRGANIIDLIHLPTDKLVLDNLKKKRELQSLSLGEVLEALK